MSCISDACAILKAADRTPAKLRERISSPFGKASVPKSLPTPSVPCREPAVHEVRDVHGGHARLDQIFLAREVGESLSLERSRPNPQDLVLFSRHDKARRPPEGQGWGVKRPQSVARSVSSLSARVCYNNSAFFCYGLSILQSSKRRLLHVRDVF